MNIDREIANLGLGLGVTIGAICALVEYNDEHYDEYIVKRRYIKIRKSSALGVTITMIKGATYGMIGSSILLSIGKAIQVVLIRRIERNYNKINHFMGLLGGST